MLEALNHVVSVLVKYVIMCLEMTLFQQKHVGKYLKLKVGLLTVTQKRLFTFWDAKFAMILPMFEKPKQISVFGFWFNNYKSKHRSFQKGKPNVVQKRFHSHYVQDCHRRIDDFEVTFVWEQWNAQTNNLKENVLATQIEDLLPTWYKWKRRIFILTTLST